LSINDYVEDIREMANYLIKKFDKQKIILVGRSWGSIIGSLAAKRYPELFHAYIGIGQVVNMMEGERISYEYTLERAREENNEEAINELESIGFSPHDNFKYLLIQRKWLKHYGGVIRDSRILNLIFTRYINNSPEYTKTDRLKLVKGNVESHKYLWDQMLEINFLRDLTDFELPTYYCAGRFDFNTPSVLMEKYFELINAPKKEIFWFEESAHGISFEEPRRFLDICRRITTECGITT
jgi:pimeloyl-ACP methyl ester carboxylesterase